MTAQQQNLLLQPLRDPKKIESVFDAIDGFDLTASSAWADLDALSTHTSFDEIQPNLDGMFERSDGAVEIVGSAYVTLQYGGKRDNVSMTESYPAKIIGHFEGDIFQIEDVTVDSSSFYA